jgi:hypothetical protein
MTETRSTRARVIPLAAAAAILASAIGGLIITSRLAGRDAVLPDLTSEPPGAPAFAVKEWPEGSGDQRLVLRFDGVVSNIGAGPLHVEGDPRGSALAGSAIAQVLYDGNGEVASRLVLSTGGAESAVQFENTDGHGHWHLMRVAEYALFDEPGETLVWAGDKIGFCLSDVEPVPDVAGPEPPGVYPPSNQCQAGAPDATDLAMGISPGWSDVYSFALALQWIDVTDLTPGVYRLAGRADPEDFLRESNEVNDWVFRDELVVVPGLVAESATVAVSGPTTFDLDFRSFEGTIDLTPDNTGDVAADLLVPTRVPVFRIVTGPANGVLSVPTGTMFDIGEVTYTPNSGFTGTDGFTFEVIDPGFDNPAAVQRGEVKLSVEG